jgi:hypothetical protein
LKSLPAVKAALPGGATNETSVATSDWLTAIPDSIVLIEVY